MSRRVVITGRGAICPVGASVAESEAALREGKHGIRYMPEWDDIVDLQGRLGATAPEVDWKARYHRRKRRTMGQVALLAVHATEEAIAESGLSEDDIRSLKTGIAYGSTSGSSDALEQFSKKLTIDKTMRGLQSNAYLQMMTHTAAANVAYFFGVKGRVQPTCAACASGAMAIGAGFEAIKLGQQDVMICGGAEESHYTSAVTFDLLMATSTKYNERPDESPRPFDASRDGLVVGEGAATVVLESYEHAKARGATIYGEVLSYASTCDGSHMTAPNPEGMRNVMVRSLANAGLEPSAIDYVNAHATATTIGDVAESMATHEVFGSRVPISSQKGYVGHTLGACGALELIWTLGMMRDSLIIPNRNFTEKGPKCAELDYVAELRQASVRTAMTNNFAFGGINTSLVLTSDIR